MNAQFDWTVYAHLPFLLVAVSLVYSATRHDRWDRLLWEAVGWIFRMGGFLLGLGAVLYVLSTYPKYGPYFGVLLGIGMLVYYLVSSPWFLKKKPPPPAGATAPAPAPRPAPANAAAPMAASNR